jgi:hypothetical protein
MKKVPLLAGAAALAALGAVPAVAATTTGANHGTVLTASASPSKAGTKKKPKGVKIHTLFTVKPPASGQSGFATSRTVVHLPKGIVFNYAKFKACSVNTLNSSGPAACPAGSKVGSGTAQGVALGQTENLTVTAFNGGAKQLLLYVQGSAPLQINSTIVGTLKKDNGKYGYLLDVAIPANLQQPLSGVYATLTKFDTTIGAKSGKANYAESVSCTKKTWNWGADLYFTDGTVDHTTTTSKCS